MPPLGELFRATVSYEGNGGLNQNVLHFRGDTGSETAGQLVDVMINIYWVEFRKLLPLSVRLLNVTAQQLTPIVRDPSSGTSLNPDGTLPSAELNSQLAVIFTLRTGFASRRQRGRIYLGTPSASNVTVNELTAPGRALYTTFRDEIATNFVGDAALTTFQLGVYSRLTGGDGPIFDADALTPATQIDVQSNLGAQRRRRLGRGA